jgi:hypothetical protein
MKPKRSAIRSITASEESSRTYTSTVPGYSTAIFRTDSHVFRSTCGASPQTGRKTSTEGQRAGFQRRTRARCFLWSKPLVKAFTPSETR